MTLLKNSYQLDLNSESVVSRRDVAGEAILGVNKVGYVLSIGLRF